MSRLLAIILVATSVAPAFPQAFRCAYAPSHLQQRNTLGQDFEEAKFVFFGYPSNPRSEPPATDWHIEEILKSDAILKDKKVVTDDRYVDVKDSKTRFIVFGDVH